MGPECDRAFWLRWTTICGKKIRPHLRVVFLFLLFGCSLFDDFGNYRVNGTHANTILPRLAKTREGNGLHVRYGKKTIIGTQALPNTPLEMSFAQMAHVTGPHNICVVIWIVNSVPLSKLLCMHVKIVRGDTLLRKSRSMLSFHAMAIRGAMSTEKQIYHPNYFRITALLFRIDTCHLQICS